MNEESIKGCILGTAVGDALGLPYEGLAPQRAKRLLGPVDRYRFIFGYGMVSDDTEHTCMVAQSLIDGNGDVERFARSFAWRLRFWLPGLPAGVGFATLRAVCKLWLGFNHGNSGVFSAGNGPAMRAAVFGAAFDDNATIKSYVTAATLITHTDPKALYGALAVALAARMARQHQRVEPGAYLTELKILLEGKGEELVALVESSAASVARGETTRQFAAAMGLERGVSGYVFHTVPVVIHAWLRHQREFRNALVEMIECGGDADTTAAILGGIIGGAVGRASIPGEWLAGLAEWPGTVAWMEDLAAALANTIQGGQARKPAELYLFLRLPRNLLVLGWVLLHGFRRLLPPY